HDSGRFLTLGLWLAASGLCGVALFRLSGSALIGIAGLVLSFILLGILGAGQLHPLTPISFLLAAMVCVMAVLLPFRPGIAMAAIGAIAAAMLLIKLNVGGFAVAPLALACVACVPQLRRSDALVAVLASALVVLPFALVSGE